VGLLAVFLIIYWRFRSYYANINVFEPPPCSLVYLMLDYATIAINLEVPAGRPGSRVEAPRYFRGRRGESRLDLKPITYTFYTRIFVSSIFFLNSLSSFVSKIGEKNKSIPNNFLDPFFKKTQIPVLFRS